MPWDAVQFVEIQEVSADASPQLPVWPLAVVYLPGLYEVRVHKQAGPALASAFFL
ncbi:MAG: hypothetical protein Q4D97_02610 [Eubacteriales bacterium]|nr:hypothetical protein [Eubacteriales bacterium]